MFTCSVVVYYVLPNLIFEGFDRDRGASSSAAAFALRVYVLVHA